MTIHSRLWPSNVYRWVVCPGSVELCKDIPRTSSVFADEGKATHMLAERCLNEGVDAADYACDRIDVDGRAHVVTVEMVEAVQLYLDVVRKMACASQISVEQKVDLSWIPGLGNSIIDVKIFSPAGIVDFKYGAGVPVEVKDNPQLMLYALGAFGIGLDVETTIVQPRCPHVDGPVRSARYTAGELLDFAIRIMLAAEVTTRPDAPLVTGDHCRFCPAQLICPALYAVACWPMRAETFLPTSPGPETLSPERLADILGKARLLKTWVKAVEAHAHAEALAGRAPPGFKLVTSRAMRRWSASADDVLAAVSEFGLTTDDIYETNLISPAAMDKLLKKNKTAIVPFVTKVSSGTILVDEADPRPSARLSGSEVFQIESDEE